MKDKISQFFKNEDNLEFVKSSKLRPYVSQSQIISCEPGKIYQISADVIGIKGTPFCGCLGVIALNKQELEIERKIQWLNDFSGKTKRVTLFFKAPTNKIVIMYRINQETPEKSDCEFKITPIHKISISENTEISDESQLLNDIPEGFTSEQAISRWKESGPNKGLTWGKIISGDAFIELAKKYDIFSPEKSILELGPGYGRILSSVISKKIPFKHYTGLDISQKSFQELEKKFSDENIDFELGDFKSVKLKRKYDIVLSSAVLKHQFPTFYESLKNIHNFINNSGIFFFDLRENLDFKDNRKELSDLIKLGPSKSNWEEGTKTYVAYYTQDEVRKLIDSLGQEFISFEHVLHDKDIGERLVIISRKK